MGYGDFKLFAALGAWFGWQALVPIILMSSVIGVGRRHRAASSAAGCAKAATCPSAPSWPAPGFTAMIFGPGDAILRVARPLSKAAHAMRIGLTGGIGSGKSTVLRCWSRTAPR